MHINKISRELSKGITGSTEALGGVKLVVIDRRQYVNKGSVTGREKELS